MFTVNCLKSFRAPAQTLLPPYPIFMVLIPHFTSSLRNSQRRWLSQASLSSGISPAMRENTQT